MSPWRSSSSHARRGRAGPGLLEHRRRGVDADDLLAGRLRDRDRDPPVPDRQLDQRPVRLAGQRDVEGDVGRHVRRPFLVAVRERLVPAHRPMFPRCGLVGQMTTGELRITSVFPCVARGFKPHASFRFTGYCWWRSLAVDGGSGTSGGHAWSTLVMRRPCPHLPHRTESRRAGSGEDDARASEEFRAVLVEELGHRARGVAGDLLEGAGRVVVLAGEDRPLARDEQLSGPGW